MALEFNRLDYEKIVKIAQNPSPESFLQQMNIWELQLLKERIDEITKNDPDAEKLFGNLMRLKAYAILTEESLRSAVGPGW